VKGVRGRLNRRNGLRWMDVPRMLSGRNRKLRNGTEGVKSRVQHTGREFNTTRRIRVLETYLAGYSGTIDLAYAQHVFG
jgi:hypothetical protein